MSTSWLLAKSTPGTQCGMTDMAVFFCPQSEKVVEDLPGSDHSSEIWVFCG